MKKMQKKVERKVKETFDGIAFYRNLVLTTNNTVNNGFHQSFSFSYIREAGRPLLIHWIQCLSLLTARGCRQFFAPIYHFPGISSLQNSNDI